MSSNSIDVQVREQHGSRNSRRMRAAGQTPAVLYGQGAETVSLSIPSDQVASVIVGGAKLVEMKGGASGSALVRDVQWDAFGNEVLHVDLNRVSASEKVEVTLPIELRGVAPGTREGGTVTQSLHELTLICPASAIPDKLECNINELGLDGAITVGDLDLGANVETTASPEDVVVSCAEEVVAEVEAVAADGAEPEVIGEKQEEDEGE